MNSLLLGSPRLRTPAPTGPAVVPKGAAKTPGVVPKPAKAGLVAIPNGAVPKPPIPRTRNDTS